MRTDLQQTMKDNTLPLALIGVGLGWLLLSGAREGGVFQQGGRHDGRHDGGMGRGGGGASGGGMMGRTYSQARDRVSDAMESVRRGADQLRQRAGGSSQDGDSGMPGRDPRNRGVGGYGDAGPEGGYGAAVGGRMSGGGAMGQSGGPSRGIGQTTRNVGESLWQMVDEHPIAAGLMGIALGAALGATLPGTRTEDELFGDYRDQLAERARTDGSDYVERLGEVAKDAARAGVDAARDHASEAADREGLTGQG